MKTVFPTALLVAALAGLLLTLLPVRVTGQPSAPATPVDEVALAQLITDIQAQQAQIKSNQTKIEETLAKVQEEIRQARIYAARGGKK